MESIDRLRGFAAIANASMSASAQAIVADLADAIEREAMEERTAAYNEGYDAGFASADDWAAQHEDAMAEHGWVRLPVDADGEPIHIGELVDEKLPFGGYAAPAPIDTMELSRGASGYCWMVKLDSESGAFINPKLLRHHRAPTVEDVLREFGKRWDDPAHYAKGELVETYAAKLWLGGEE